MSYLKQLDPIHYDGLRQVLRAFRTSPVDSLYAKAHEEIRCEKLAFQYFTKLKSCPSNPTYDYILNGKYEHHFEKKEKTIKPLSLWMKSTLKESKISLNNIHESILSQTPPWIIKKPKVIFKLNALPKTKINSSIYQEKFCNILQHHPNHLYVFTDKCLQDNDKTACAAVLNKNILKKALPMDSSIFTEEACAIAPALNIISTNKHKKFIIFSDLLLVLLSLSNKKLGKPLIIMLLGILYSISNCKEIIISWIPSHIGARGNKRADLAAKSALGLSPNKFRIL